MTKQSFTAEISESHDTMESSKCMLLYPPLAAVHSIQNQHRIRDYIILSTQFPNKDNGFGYNL